MKAHTNILLKTLRENRFSLTEQIARKGTV